MSAFAAGYPSNRVVEFFVIVTLAVTTVSATACVVSLFLRRQPALRHCLLFSALLGALASPVAFSVFVSLGMSLVSIPLLSAEISPSGASGIPSEGLFLQAGTPRSIPAAEFTSRDASLGDRIAAPDDTHSETGTADMAPIEADPMPANTDDHQTLVLRAAFLALLGMWTAGTTILLAGFVRSWLQLNWLIRLAKPISEPLIAGVVREAHQLVPRCKTPLIVSSRHIHAPMAAGWLRPVVLLPTASLSAITRNQWRDVLVHEMAHVLRRDYLVALLQALAGAFFWPILFVHVLNRQLARAREEVCDNYVLAGREALSYGETLLRIAELARGAIRNSAALGILQSSSQLEERIAGIIHERRNTMKQTNALTTTAVLAMVSAICALPCGTTIIAAPEEATVADDSVRDSYRPPDSSSRQDNVVRGVEVDSRNISHRDDEVAAAVVDTVQVRGRVAGPDGKPVPRAKVNAVLPHLNRAVAATTDSDGKFVLDCGDRSEFEKAAEQDPKFEAKAVAAAEGLAFDFHNLPLEKLARSELNFRLTEPISVEGRIVAFDGEPMSDVQVRIDSIARPAGGVDAYVGMVRDRRELLASSLENTWYGAGEAKSPVKTDANGWFQLNGVGAERVVTLTLATNEGRKESIIVVTRAVPKEVRDTGLLTAFRNHYYSKFVFALPEKRVPFETRSRQFRGDDDVSIDSVVKQRTQPGAIASFEIRGRYRLESTTSANLGLWCSNGEVQGTKSTNVEKGEGEFDFVFSILKRGNLHLSYYPSQGGNSFGSLYFDLFGQATIEPDGSKSASPPRPSDSFNRPAAVEWQTETAPYFRLHYAAQFVDDAKRVRRYLDQAVENLGKEFGSGRVQKLLESASVDVYVHPQPTEQAAEGSAMIQTEMKQGRYHAGLHVLTPSAHSPNARTSVGEPMDDNYIFKNLVHEYSTIVLECLTREKSQGWSFFSAPSWFVQGYEEYLGLMLSSEHSRRVTFEKYREFHRADRMRVGAGFEGAEPYLDGAVLLQFLHETYGKERVHAILLSDAPDFWSAINQVLSQSREQLYESWSRWVQKL
jgi:beta-lactamase regulating signal transducer with metallopeptidase domain